jgi:hypothetical protein
MLEVETKTRDEGESPERRALDWLQFAASVIGSLAWPATVVGIALLIHKPLIAMLPGLKSLRYKEFQIEFDAQLMHVGEQVEQVTRTTEPEVLRSVGSIKRRLLEMEPDMLREEGPVFQVPKTDSPRAGIAEAWASVEYNLRELARGAGINSGPPVSSSEITQALQSKEKIDTSTAAIIAALLELRNKAVHHPGGETLPAADAERYRELAELVNQYLRAQLRPR